MSKWMCGMCGRLSDEKVPHGTGNVASYGEGAYEKQCGPWLEVTHVYRAGQEAMRERAAQQGWLETLEFYDDADTYIRALPLEGDEEEKMKESE